MNTFTQNEYNVLTKLLSYTEPQLKQFLYKYLVDNNYRNIILNKNSIVAEGEIPIALVAHLDTVFYTPSKEQNVIWDQRKNILINPVEGAGFDDKAGVMGIIQIIATGLRPHIIFTCGEETTGIGATEVASLNPFPNLRYIIELDRCGGNDCVFYNCNNDSFVDFVESYGFNEAYGTFSDISIICPAWRIAGVNLSIGYMDEHSKLERLYTKWYKSTINRVRKMLLTPPENTFEYIPYNDMKCGFCGNTGNYTNIISVNHNGSVKLSCIDCAVKNDVNWCVECGEAYTGMGRSTVCRKCRKVNNGT